MTTQVLLTDANGRSTSISFIIMYACDVHSFDTTIIMEFTIFFKYCIQLTQRKSQTDTATYGRRSKKCDVFDVKCLNFSFIFFLKYFCVVLDRTVH